MFAKFLGPPDHYDSQWQPEAETEDDAPPPAPKGEAPIETEILEDYPEPPPELIQVVNEDYD